VIRQHQDFLLESEYLSVILFAPEVIVVAKAGRVIAYVKLTWPVTVKAAAVTVPVVAGRVTPPVVLRAFAGVRITVPSATLDATLPKFISVVFVIVIGETMVAVADAVADTCENASAE
jgi:hypothetical protein